MLFFNKLCFSNIGGACPLIPSINTFLFFLPQPYQTSQQASKILPGQGKPFQAGKLFFSSSQNKSQKLFVLTMVSGHGNYKFLAVKQFQ